MSSRVHIAAAIAGAATSGVTAGVYINFSTRVMPALGRLAPADGISRMQQFNRNAVRPPFMICFFGAAVAGGYFVIRAMRGNMSRADLLAATGGGLYLLGFVLTVGYNVPLNDKLAKAKAVDPGALPFWENYLSHWTTANTVRAVFSALAAAALTGAAVAMLTDPGADTRLN